MAAENVAAWIESPYADLVVAAAPTPSLRAGRVLIRVHAVAINPLDAIVQSNGRLMYRWLRYPVVLGEDVAGVVVATAPDVASFREGDRVVAYATGIEKGSDPVGGGGFQHEVAVDSGLAARIPDDLTFAEASVLPLALSTAAAGLFETSQLGLRLDGLGRGASRDEVVVIWGGATSVGMNAIQLAVSAGYRVVATASRRNHLLLEELGADAVVDYHRDDAVAAVISAVGGRRVAGVLAIPTGSAHPSVLVAAATSAARVAIASPPVGFWDQPRRPGPSFSRMRLLARLVSRSVAVQLTALRHRIRASYVWGSSIAHSPVGAAVWRDYLPTALASGSHRALPRPMIVGSGLDAVQGALDAVREGVTAQKLVVTIDEDRGVPGAR